MAYGTVNADVIGTSVANTSLGAGNATNFKNRIINGAMVIDQRNAGASVTPTNGQYLVDRWVYYANQASKFTAQQNKNSVTTPLGFTNYLGLTSSSAYTVGSTDYFWISQPIEGLNVVDLGWGTANAKTVTLSFQVYSSLTGTFGGALQNSAETRSYPFAYTISSANTWTSISVTIAGDTTGTWLTTNGVGIYVAFGLGIGSTFSTTAGAWAAGNYISATGATNVVSTNGANWYITGVQLEVGSSATGFEYRDYTTQLLMCQRYYAKLNSDGSGGDITLGVGINKNTTSAKIYIKYPVTLRTKPTVTSASMQASDYVNFANDATIGSIQAAYDSTTIDISFSAAGTSLYPVAYVIKGNVNGYVAFSAEL
jgi:hypothetical protein